MRDPATAKKSREELEAKIAAEGRLPTLEEAKTLRYYGYYERGCDDPDECERQFLDVGDLEDDL